MKTLMMDKTSFESRNNSDAHNLDSKNQSQRIDTLTNTKSMNDPYKSLNPRAHHYAREID